MGFDNNLKETIGVAMSRYYSLRKRVLRSMPSGDRMCLEYMDVIQWLLISRECNETTQENNEDGTV